VLTDKTLRLFTFALGGIIGAGVVLITPRLLAPEFNGQDYALLLLGAIPFVVYYGLLVGMPIVAAGYFCFRPIVSVCYRLSRGFAFVVGILIAAALGFALSIVISGQNGSALLFVPAAVLASLPPILYFFSEQ
jgi:hypothetical protein